VTSGYEKLKLLTEIIEYYSSKDVPDSVLIYGKTALTKCEEFGDSLYKGKILWHLSLISTGLGQIDTSLNYLYEAEDFYEIKKDSVMLGWIYLNIGYNFLYKYSFDLSKEYIEKALSILSIMKDNVGMVYGYFYKCDIDIHFMNFPSAMENCLKALAISQELQDNELMASTYSKIGNIYYNMKNYEKALEYDTLAFAFVVDSQNLFSKALLLNSIGSDLHKMSQNDSAKIYLKKSMIIFFELGYELYFPNFLYVLGDIEMDSENFSQASDYYLKTLKYSEKYNVYWYKSYTYNRLGYLCLKENKNDLVLFYLNKSDTIARKIASPELILDNYLLSSKYYEKTKKYKLALYNYQKFIQLKDSLITQSQNSVTDLQISYYEQRAEEAKELLQKDNAILKLETDKQKLLKTRLLLGFALVSLLTIIVFYLYRHKQRLNRVLQLRIEEALRQQCEQQAIISHQAGLTTLGELAAGVAHEVNQPLQNITLCAESIGISNKANPIPDADIKAGVQEISGYIDRIRSIMEHIRLFSRGQNQEYFQNFNINEYIENALRMISQQLKQSGISVKQELMNKLPLVTGNPYQYERVVMNLILNARDAVEEKGKQVNGGYCKEIMVKSWYEANHVILEVTDNGIGIPENQQSKIFQAFYSTKKLGEGQGIGLSIANRTIQRMGGRIEVKSEVLTGTTMRVVVPTSLHNNSILEYINLEQMPRDNSHARE